MPPRRVLRPVARQRPSAHDPTLQPATPLAIAEQIRSPRINPGGGLTANTIATLPGVHSFSAMTRYIHGGRKRVIEIIQMAMLNNEPTACKWWAIYADLQAYQQSRISLDDVCAASNVTPRELIMVIVSTAIEFGADVANLIAATTQPAVVHQLAKSARRIGGSYADIAHKDRIAFLQSRGFLPVPKSAVVNIHASASAQAAAAAASEPSVPRFASDLGGVDAAKREIQNQITEGEVIPPFLDKTG